MAVSGLDLAQPRRRPIDRSNDRLVAMAAIALAIAYLCAALAVALLPAQDRAGLWLPLHLAVAGAASTAIAVVRDWPVTTRGDPRMSAAEERSPVIRQGSRMAVAPTRQMHPARVLSGAVTKYGPVGGPGASAERRAR